MSALAASSVGESAMPLVCTRQTDSQDSPTVLVCSPLDDYFLGRLHNANVVQENRNHLSKWRMKRGLTQEELADKVGTTKSVVSLLENELRPLSSKWLRLFADALKTTPGRILDIDPDEVSAEMLEAWDSMKQGDRARAIRVLRSLTGTHD